MIIWVIRLTPDLQHQCPKDLIVTTDNVVDGGVDVAVAADGVVVAEIAPSLRKAKAVTEEMDVLGIMIFAHAIMTDPLVLQFMTPLGTQAFLLR
jgi:hypothetical protein